MRGDRMYRERLNSLFSRGSSWAGIACLVHCMTLPFLIGVLPAIGLSFLANGWFEFAVLGTAVAFSLTSLCWGVTKHGKQRLFGVLAAAVLFFILAHTTSHEILFMLVGGGCMGLSNYLNMKLCGGCHNCCEHTQTKAGKDH
jgi:hypothetical protein